MLCKIDDRILIRELYKSLYFDKFCNQIETHSHHQTLYNWEVLAYSLSLCFLYPIISIRHLLFLPDYPISISCFYTLPFSLANYLSTLQLSICVFWVTYHPGSWPITAIDPGEWLRDHITQVGHITMASRICVETSRETLSLFSSRLETWRHQA